MVVIDRLPFNPPTTRCRRPSNASTARSNAFRITSCRAVIAQQGGSSGETDCGALVICDPRLVDKPYGKRIWRALPPFRRTRSLADVEAFFGARAVGKPAVTVPGRTSIPRGTP